jgi:hypothetical protein
MPLLSFLAFPPLLLLLLVLHGKAPLVPDDVRPRQWNRNRRLLPYPMPCPAQHRLLPQNLARARRENQGQRHQPLLPRPRLIRPSVDLRLFLLLRFSRDRLASPARPVALPHQSPQPCLVFFPCLHPVI